MLDKNKVVSDWLRDLDKKILYSWDKEEELWHNSKLLLLDSIQVLEYIRRETDNIPLSLDRRMEMLLGIALSPARYDYYQRFLGHKSKYYPSEDLWWIDCWQSVRLNNLLHELNIRNVIEYFEDDSDGKNFKLKFPDFFSHSKSEIFGGSSLPAFSYIECLRLIKNWGKKNNIDEFLDFSEKLCEKEGSELKLFPRSNEIRCKALSLVEKLALEYPDSSKLKEIRLKLKETLKEMILNYNWNKYSHTWSTIFLDVSDKEITDLAKSKIQTQEHVDSGWVKGNNSIRKPRYALLLLLNELGTEKKYFEIIEPLRFKHTPIGELDNKAYVASIVDGIMQGFRGVKDIQKKVQDSEIKEEYFRDLLKFSLEGTAKKDSYIDFVEKEGATTSGRETDVFIITSMGADIPIELKLLWRFKEGYEPIGEVLDQVRTGDFAITVMINPPENPKYSGKYQDFEGYKNFVEDHVTYVSGTLSENIGGVSLKLKTKHFFSEHKNSYGGKENIVTLLHFFIDLRDYTRSEALKKL